MLVTTSATSPPTQGRPRDPAKDAAVIAATRELLVEMGYHGLTVVAIARRAGVGAPTIYRRWPTKESLVEYVAFDHSQAAPLPAPSGDLDADLRAWVELFLDYLAEPVQRAALPGLLAVYQGDDDKYEHMLSFFQRDVRVLIVDLIARALPDLDKSDCVARADTVFDVMMASTTLRALTRGLSDRETFCAITTRTLGLLARSPLG
jgi:AcrR family transcriptional regulator